MSPTMNRTVTARETREMFRQLDLIKELTDLLRRTHFDVPYRTVYDAAGAEAVLRERLLGVALTDIEIEAPVLAEVGG
jgi:hypothetical protein